MVNDFFETGLLIENINETNIMLIPKKKNPTTMSELRPIALCNIVMKIITKVIANRLKEILESVISDTQSAFLPGRIISDNIMLSFEVMHYLKRRKFGKEGYMAIILDIAKAYDQGLKALIKHYEANKWLQGVKICRNAPVLSHILFADDSYLYCKADKEEANRIMGLLTTYEKTSGQKVNRSKSSVFFSANVIQYNKERVCQELQINEADGSSKYLGLPNILGRKKSVIFGYLKEKVKAGIQNWTERHVSRPAKEILIKMVAQALPSFSMNASIGSSPSFIWRSIIEARKVISEGSYWRIGTGKEIMIIDQPWLNNVENPYIATNSPSDQQCILNTTVERSLDRDVLSWKAEHSGQYSVKSAYQSLQRQKCRVATMCWKIFDPGINTETTMDFSAWLQVDATIFEKEGLAGVGLITRDHDGQLLLARTKLYAEVMQPILVEALVVKEALSWLKDMGWMVTIIESDCQVVVQMIRTHELARASHMYPDHIFDWSDNSGGVAAPSTASWILRRCRGVAVVGFLKNNTGKGVGVPRHLRREKEFELFLPHSLDCAEFGESGLRWLSLSGVVLFLLPSTDCAEFGESGLRWLSLAGVELFFPSSPDCAEFSESGLRWLSLSGVELLFPPSLDCVEFGESGLRWLSLSGVELFLPPVRIALSSVNQD
ncbi:hypothetical protein AgCh_006108 [Apium graveolens]